MRSTAKVRLLIIASLCWSVSTAATVSSELPELGDSSSAIVSLEMEQEIGKQLLRQVHAGVPTISDPLLKYYTEKQLYSLAEHSELKRKHLYPVLIDAQEVNAFAAPGGVVGINLGLYLTAEDVNEYAAVIAHELAHLSQRHFARQIEMQQQSTLPYLAAMLASIVVAATTGGQAGLAAISATQAAAQSSQLQFSREREAEADRIGISTLAAADLDPGAMARMFAQMQRAYRFSKRPPEFLLTHPVSEARISDARNQASEYPAKPYADAEDFQLMKARATVHYASTPQQAVAQFRALVERTEGADWAYYGLILALSESGDHDGALDTAKPLFAKHPDSLLYMATKAELLIAASRHDEAIELLSAQLVINPENKPLSILYANALSGARRFREAEAVLLKQSLRSPDDVDVWYDLAETAGLAGDIVQVHLARAEYFTRVGNLQKSIQHLEYARRLVSSDNYRLTAMLDQRIRDLSAELAESQRRS